MRTLARSIFLLALTASHPTAQTSHRNLPNASLIHYDLNVTVLPDAHQLKVEGSMRLPSSNAPRAKIQLSLSELMSALEVVIENPLNSAGTAKLEKTKVENGSVTWDVLPSHPFQANELIRLRFSYSGGGQIAPIFYVGPEVTFASAYGTDWYPLIVGSQGRGIGSLKISIPAGEMAIAEGERRSSPESEAQGTFVFENNHPTYFSFASGKYTVVRRSRVIPVSAYLLRPRQNIERHLGQVSKILRVLETEFGPYPFNGFAVVEVPRELAQKAYFNAATVQGFAYVNSNAFNLAPADLNAILEWYGHEFSHEWWPNVVALKRPGGRYLEEALAEYGGLRVVEALAGSVAAEQFRRTGYAPDPIYSALEYFKLVGAGFDRQLADLPSGPKFREIAYNKGFLVWDMLAREIGRETFRNILRSISRRYAFQELTWRQFWHAIEVGSGRNMKWFYKQWFYRTGAPDFQLTWKQKSSRLSGEITQAAPHYRAALEVEILGSQGQRVVRKVRVHSARTKFNLPIRFHVQSVTLDSHYLILRWTPEYRAAANAAAGSQ